MAQTLLLKSSLRPELLTKNPFPSQSGQITIPYFSGTESLRILTLLDSAQDSSCLGSVPFHPAPRFLHPAPIFFRRSLDFRDPIDNLFAKEAFPTPRMAAIFEEFFEDHETTTARTIDRALTIHMNLLRQSINLIQTDRCHDFMKGMLNFYDRKPWPYQYIFQEGQLSEILANLILD